MSKEGKGFVDGFLDGFRSLWWWRSKDSGEGKLKEKVEDPKPISGNGPSLKELEELRRRQKIEFERKRTATRINQKIKRDKEIVKERKEDFRIKCKRMGWSCFIVLLLAWLSLTYFDRIFGKEFRFVEYFVFFWKWILGVGVVSYGFLNMVMTFEHYLTQWVREHREDFLKGTNLGWRSAWGFWKYMMGDTIFFGCGKIVFPFFRGTHKSRVRWKKFFVGKSDKDFHKHTAKSTDVGF